MSDTTSTDVPPPRSTPADTERRSAIKSGAFLVGAVVLGALVVGVLANAHRVFERKHAYVVYFSDVNGLQPGSPVRLGGLSVGLVDSITFSPDMKDTRILVRVQVAQKFASRVRADSVARVASLGVLGDKTVDISLGSDQGILVADGGELIAGTGGDITSMMKSTSEVVDNVVAISNDVRTALAGFTDPRFREDVTGSVKSLHAVLNELANGKGAAHSLFYDAQTGDDLNVLLASAARTAHRLDAAVTKVDAMLEEVRVGDGTANALLYGSEGKRAISELGAAATEVTAMIQDVKKSKNSAVHAMVYGDSKAMVDDLSAAATNLKNVSEKVDKGEGSLGALVNDPTVYEDLKSILGNVKRNRVLRELVRYTVSNRGEFEDSGKASVDAVQTPGPESTPVPLSQTEPEER